MRTTPLRKTSPTSPFSSQHPLFFGPRTFLIMKPTASPALIAPLFVPYTLSLQIPGVVQVPIARNYEQAVRKRANSNFASADLTNLATAYTINISIAGQPTSVVLDTGSFELWVDPDCSTASRVVATGSDADSSDTIVTVDSPVSSPHYCKKIGRYDPSTSSSAEALGSGAVLRYADTTTIEINYYTDTIDIGGLTIDGQQFGVANVTNATGLGIMGLGPNTIAGYNVSSQSYNLILDSMASQGQITSRAFSLNLRDFENSTGSLIFGGLDKRKLAGSLQTLPLESVQMTSQTADGHKVTFTNYAYVYILAESFYPLFQPERAQLLSHKQLLRQRPVNRNHKTQQHCFPGVQHGRQLPCRA